MNKITVYALEGCEKCKYLLGKLDTLGVQYTTHFCEEVSNICDTLEELTGWYSYPIVTLEMANRKEYLNSMGTRRKSEDISKYNSLEYFPDLDIMAEYIDQRKK